MGILRCFSNPWTLQLHLVPKPSGGWLPCHHQVNAAALPYRYSFPHIQDFAVHLDCAKIFSKIYLIRGYHQVSVAEADISKTMFMTPLDLFEFLHTRCVNCLILFLFILTIILIASSLHHGYQKHLKMLFQNLSGYSALINLKKCKFRSTHFDFLNYHIDKAGARPLSTKNTTLLKLNSDSLPSTKTCNFPAPKTKKNLQKFINMINFFHLF